MSDTSLEAAIVDIRARIVDIHTRAEGLKIPHGASDAITDLRGIIAVVHDLAAVVRDVLTVSEAAQYQAAGTGQVGSAAPEPSDKSSMVQGGTIHGESE